MEFHFTYGYASVMKLLSRQLCLVILFLILMLTFQCNDKTFIDVYDQESPIAYKKNHSIHEQDAYYLL